MLLYIEKAVFGLYKSGESLYTIRTFFIFRFFFIINFTIMSKSEVVALSLIREAEVSTLSAEKEMQFVQVLNNVTLVDARKFLGW